MADIITAEELARRLEGIADPTTVQVAIARTLERSAGPITKAIKEEIRGRNHYITGEMFRTVSSTTQANKIITTANARYSGWVDYYSERKYGRGFMTSGLLAEQDRIITRLGEEYNKQVSDKFAGRFTKQSTRTKTTFT